MIKEEELDTIFYSNVFQEINNEIALKSNCSVDKSPILFDMVKREILDSGVSPERIKFFIQNKRKLIIDFGIKFLLFNNNKPDVIGCGACITYSIYLIYIEDMPEKLLEYINYRRIPRAKTVLKELMLIMTEINS